MATKKNRKNLVIALVLIGVVGIGYFLFKKKEQELLNATMKGMDLGARFGQIVPQGQCLSGLKMAYSSCKDTACELSAHGFISKCLETAEKDNFCPSLPSPKDSSAALAWAGKTCSELQRSGTKCGDYIHKVLSVCHEQTTGKKRTTEEMMQDGFNRGYEKSR